MATTKTTFLDLPPEIRNQIYDLSGCLKVHQCRYCTQQWRGDGPESTYIFDSSGDTAATCPPPRQCCVMRLSIISGSSCPTRLSCASDDPVSFWVNRSSHLIPKPKPETHKTADGYLRVEEGARCGVIPCYGQSHAHDHMLRVEQPALTRVCKKVRRETSPMFYGTYGLLFTLFDTAIDSAAIVKWFETIGPTNAASLRELRIVCRMKQQVLYVEKTLVPTLRLLGVRVDDVIKTFRIGFPFCFCETCVMKSAGVLK